MESRTSSRNGLLQFKHVLQVQSFHPTQQSSIFFHRTPLGTILLNLHPQYSVLVIHNLRHWIYFNFWPRILAHLTFDMDQVSPQYTFCASQVAVQVLRVACPRLLTVVQYLLPTTSPKIIYPEKSSSANINL